MVFRSLSNSLNLLFGGRYIVPAILFLRRVLDFIYVHPIVFWRTCKAQWVCLLVYYANTNWITRQGHLRWFDEAIARFAGRNFNRHFFEVWYAAQAVGASASHEISHMRRRYSALSRRLNRRLWERNGGEVEIFLERLYWDLGHRGWINILQATSFGVETTGRLQTSENAGK